MRRKRDGGDASAKSGADDQECGGKCWTSPQDHEAHSMERRCIDLEERRRCKDAGPLLSKKKGMGKALGVWSWRRLSSRSVFLWSGLGRRISAFQGRSCECCAGSLSTRGECSSKNVRRNHCRPSRPFCQGQGKNMEVAEMIEKVMKKLKRRSREKRPQIFSHGKWEGRKEEDDCVVWLLGGRTASMQQGRRSDFGRQRGNAGCRRENKSQEAGSERRSERKEVQSEILDYQEEQSFPEKLYEGWCKEVVASRHGTGKDVESSCSGDSSHGKVEIEETDGSSSGQKEYSLLVHVHGSIPGVSLVRTFSNA